MRRILQTATLMTACLLTPAMAEMSPVVVELYTSQGCSSCPPADEILSTLSARDDVIALAFHVDYWDYIGWADIFADPAHTKRQQDYATAAGETAIYTPQFVIGGTDIVIGARAMDLADLISTHRMRAHPVDLDLTWVGDDLTIAADMGDAGQVGTYIIQLAQILPVQSVDIRRGENAGKTVNYSNIVQSLDVVGAWDGRAAVRYKADVTGASQVAVIVQSGTNGPIVGAAKIMQ